MPIIQHRFRNELEDLEQHPKEGHYHLLVVGTFNPEDVPDISNHAKWFYGRCDNRFWYLLPRMMGLDSLHIYENHDHSLNQLAVEWRNFCTEHRIILTDIYKSIEADIVNFDDKDILNPAAHEAFNYAIAFDNVIFDAVLITRKTWANNTVMGTLLQSVANYFEARDIPVLRMLTPSPRGKEQNKLQAWTEKYQALNLQ